MIFKSHILFITTWINLISSEISNVGALHDLHKETYLDLSTTKLAVPERWLPKYWLDPSIKLGQVSGLCVDRDNYVYLFHRADRVWSMNSFTADNIFRQRNLGPIRNHTVLVLGSDGTIYRKWGAEMFYLPHGITVDNEYNVWVTDVALHQVMKFSASSWTTPLLSVGVAFTPGSDSRHLCKPTSVAVTSSGDFFVADGYCNSRILKFNSDGDKILEWGRPTVGRGFRVPTPGEFLVPHALTIAEDLGIVCVADRENGRVQCFNLLNASFAFQLKSEHIGPRVFSVTYCKTKGLFFLVNGEAYQRNIPVQGFVMTAKGDIIGKFGTHLKTPHDLAITSNCDVLYVGEIDPYTACKFELHENLSTTSLAAPVMPSSSANIMDNKVSRGEVEGLAGAIMVTGACLVFAASLLIAALVYSRSRRTGTSDTIRLLPDSTISEY